MSKLINVVFIDQCALTHRLQKSLSSTVCINFSILLFVKDAVLSLW